MGTTILLTLAILGIAMAGMAVRLFFIKGAEFRGTCASKNPMLTNEIGECNVCGKVPGTCDETDSK